MGNKKSRERQKQVKLTEVWNKARLEPRPIDADVMVPGIGLRRVQIVYAPSFDPGFSWDIRERNREFVLYHSRISLADRRYELKGYDQLEFPGQILETYFTKLRSLTLSIDVYNGSTGLDGTFYHLALFDMSTSARFIWWGEPPVKWKAMADLAKEMIERFQNLGLSESAREPFDDQNRNG